MSDGVFPYSIRYFRMRVLPSISCGWFRPIRSSMVGAMSARRPSRRRTAAPTMQKGTGFVVWAVKGWPFSSSICSALPWSAVMRATPPRSVVAFTTWATHVSTVSTAATAASKTPVWPTMSQLAKFRMMTSYLPLSMRRMASSVMAGGAHLGLQIIGRDLGGGDQAPVLPGEDGLLDRR